MVLDVLTKITSAEKHVGQMKLQAKEEIQKYFEQEEERFQFLQNKSQKKVKQFFQEQTLKQTNLLNKEKTTLLLETEKSDQKLKEKFDQNKEKVINSLIERMQKNYGRF